jgi:hypothetical protein
MDYGASFVLNDHRYEISLYRIFPLIQGASTYELEFAVDDSLESTHETSLKDSITIFHTVYEVCMFAFDDLEDPIDILVMRDLTKSREKVYTELLKDVLKEFNILDDPQLISFDHMDFHIIGSSERLQTQIKEQEKYMRTILASKYGLDDDLDFVIDNKHITSIKDHSGIAWKYSKNFKTVATLTLTLTHVEEEDIYKYDIFIEESKKPWKNVTVSTAVVSLLAEAAKYSMIDREDSQELKLKSTISIVSKSSTHTYKPIIDKLMSIITDSED